MQNACTYHGATLINPDVEKSPWTALEFCDGVDGVEDTWVCHTPETCGCEWDYNVDLLELPIRGCAAMGSDARAALYAPSTLAPYLSLPSTAGGSTGYFSPIVTDGTSSWFSTAVDGCKHMQVPPP